MNIRQQYHKYTSLKSPKPNVIVYDKEWQYPAKTEQAAYESIIQKNFSSDDMLYIAFPWATFIDGLRNHKKGIEKLFLELNYLQELIKKSNVKKVVTVCQHILLLEFIDYFKGVGIRTIFWSHKTIKESKLENITLKPFPLYPAQTEKEYKNILNMYDDSEKKLFLSQQHKKYLTNFIGAYNEKIYLSNVRQHIFNDEGKAGYLIIKRGQWHFERAVYTQQIKGDNIHGANLLEEEKNTFEYLRVIKESEFTLCPTGSGPNSIRLFEALCLGSIPVLLTDTLDLPGKQEECEKATIIVEDSINGYKEAKTIMETMSEEEILEKKLAGLELIKKVGPNNYANIIIN